MKPKLFLIRSTGDAERELARRRQVETVRAARERHLHADPRVQLLHDALARRYEAA